MTVAAKAESIHLCHESRCSSETAQNGSLEIWEAGRLSLCCWGIPILALLDEAGLGFTKRFAGFGPDHQNTVFVRISKARTNHKPESTAQTKQLQ